MSQIHKVINKAMFKFQFLFRTVDLHKDLFQVSLFQIKQ